MYQMKITLKGIRPPIWRRVRVPGTIRLADLHHVIQTVFGWTDTHLHQFGIGGTSYGQPDDFDQVVADENAVTLAQVAGSRTKHFEYVYDFGDNWEHEVVVEKIIGGDSGSERPLCMGGKRHRPPEDCGGRWGYQRFLETIRDPGHPEHRMMLESVGGSFDPEAFDLAAVNRDLGALSLARSRVK
jgi:hypothetical protein